MIMRRLAIVALAALASACFDFDFVDPDLAEESGGAVVIVTASQVEDGDVNISAMMSPGIDDAGFIRDVENDALHVFGIPLTPIEHRRSGTRIYELTDTLPALTTFDPFTVITPRVRGLAPLPSVRWQGFRKLGPDTILIRRGESLTFPVATDPTPPQPAPPEQQWTLRLAGDENSFLIGGSSMPPSVIQIPAAWIPAPPDSILNATLTTSQSGQVRVPGYRGVFNYSASVSWTILIR